MPTYDYVCHSCGHELEVFQSMTEAPKRKCPECGTMKLQRQIGMGAGILFKGTGFYETDYRSSSYEQGKKSEVEARSAAKSEGSGKKTDVKKDVEKSPENKNGKKNGKAREGE